MQYPPTLKNNIYHSNKRESPPFFHSDTNTLSRSGPFCWQNLCSGCNSVIELLLLLNIYFFSILFQHQTNLLGSQGSKEAVKVTLLFCLMCAVQSGDVPFFVCRYLPPMIVHLRNLFLLNTRVARMLLVSKRKDVK